MTIPAIKVLGGAAGGVSVSVNDAILALSPDGYWALSETSGTTATDSSGNGRDGTYSGSVTLADVAGADGDDYPTWDATADIVFIDPVTQWAIGTGSTIFALVKPTSFDNGTANGLFIVGRLDNNTGNRFEYALAVQRRTSGSTTDMESIKTNSGFTSYRIQTSSSEVIDKDVWNAVCIRFTSDSVTASDDMFVDSNTAIGQDSPTVVGTGTAAHTNASLTIGQRKDAVDIGAADQSWRGSIAHVAIWDTELSDSDIGTLMDAAAAEGWI